MTMSTREIADRIVHPLNRAAFLKGIERGWEARFHPANSNLMNLHDPGYGKRGKGKNRIGDIPLDSEEASFRLEHTDSNRFYNYKKFGYDEKDENFIEEVFKHFED
ncbi:hypothetical protein [Mesobacillus subterraneus]|uniref:Uncharacterized protein n=1 Tax=Mesobacillus subterraneus TaxID=285983 RepID=A0A427TT50_9BACI|nr:hypothetical protein [Mesobacillus subterraneus]RSD27617.1 hypothetical protein EJA10_07485 [Mesobacillus subterraneus]